MSRGLRGRGGGGGGEREKDRGQERKYETFKLKCSPEFTHVNIRVANLGAGTRSLRPNISF